MKRLRLHAPAFAPRAPASTWCCREEDEVEKKRSRGSHMREKEKKRKRAAEEQNL